MGDTHELTEETEWAFRHRVRIADDGEPVAEQYVIGDHGERFWMDHEDVPEALLREMLRLAGENIVLNAAAEEAGAERDRLAERDRALIAAAQDFLGIVLCVRSWNTQSQWRVCRDTSTPSPRPLATAIESLSPPTAIVC